MENEKIKQLRNYIDEARGYCPGSILKLYEKELEELEKVEWQYCPDLKRHCEVGNDCADCPYGVDRYYPEKDDSSMEIGDMVYVEPSVDHVGGYGKLICILNSDECLVEFKHVLTEEVYINEIQVIC